MPDQRKLELLDRLIGHATKLNVRDEDDIQKFKNEGAMFLRRIFGPESDYVSRFKSFYFMALWTNATAEDEARAAENDRKNALSLLETAKQDFLLDFEETGPPAKADLQHVPTRIFIVHGHENEIKETGCTLC